MISVRPSDLSDRLDPVSVIHSALLYGINCWVLLTYTVVGDLGHLFQNHGGMKWLKLMLYFSVSCTTEVLLCMILSFFFFSSLEPFTKHTNQIPR